MCGRFANQLDWIEEWVELLGEWPAGATQGFNIAPTQPIAAFTADGGISMRWGLVPSWSKEPKTKYATFNAKIETASEKASYRSAWKTGRRCIIPVLGYYEWQTREGVKKPYFIRAQSNDPLLLAGLWEHWEKGDEHLTSCTVLTQNAAPSVAHVHDRMPVLIEKQSIKTWFSATPGQVFDLVDAISPDLRHFPVSSYVNNARHQGPTCIEPLDLAEVREQTTFLPDTPENEIK